MLKAFREGRVPMSGGPGEESTESPSVESKTEPVSGTVFKEVKEPSSSNFQRDAGSKFQPDTSMSQPEPYNKPDRPVYSAETKHSQSSTLKPNVADAIELGYFAVAALKANDINLAKDRFREALRRLD